MLMQPQDFITIFCNCFTIDAPAKVTAKALKSYFVYIDKTILKYNKLT